MDTGTQHKFFKVCLMPKESLYSKCDKRFLDFVEQGAIEEARAINSMSVSPDLPASKTLGLLELIKYTRGELELSDAIEQLSEQLGYAKRQLTWFRHQLTKISLRTVIKKQSQIVGKNREFSCVTPKRERYGQFLKQNLFYKVLFEAVCAIIGKSNN